MNNQIHELSGSDLGTASGGMKYVSPTTEPIPPSAISPPVWHGPVHPTPAHGPFLLSAEHP